MYAFQIERVTHFSLTRENAGLCGRSLRGGYELDRRQGPICPACARSERDAWVGDWHRRFDVLGPIKPIDQNADGINDNSGFKQLAA